MKDRFHYKSAINIITEVIISILDENSLAQVEKEQCHYSAELSMNCQSHPGPEYILHWLTCIELEVCTSINMRV